MTAKPDRNAGARWKPPMWLLVADLFSVALLTLGLVLQFAPGSSVSALLTPQAKLPLLAVGGTGAAVCWVALMLSMLSARRGR